MLGTRAFLPTLLAQLNNAAPSPIPLDPVIFQSILLVLAAGHRKNLILRAIDPEEVGIIARTAEWTLSTVFNLATHRLKIRPGRMSTDANEFVDSAAFLRSLFLSSPSSADALHDERTSSCGSIAQLAHQRNSSGHKKHGSASGSTGYADASADSPVSHPAQLDPAFPTPPYSHRRVSHHPKSKSKSRKPSATISAAHPQIPTALVVTGLEHACDMSQRALVRVLAEGRVALPKNTRVGGWSEPHTREDDEEEGWDLPENFIMVYVTSWDPRERPALHKSLLDKFSMSTNITIQSKTRKALRSISISSITTATSPHHHSHSMPSTPRSALGSLPPHPFPHPPTPHQQLVPLSQGTSNTSKSSTTNPFPPEHDYHRVPSTSTFQGTHSLPRTHSASPFLSSVPLPSDSPDPLLHPVPSRPPVTASVAPNAEPSPGLLLPTTFLPRLRHTVAHLTRISPSLNLYLQDLFTAARFDFPELDGTLLTARAMDDAEKLSRACRVLGTELGGWELIRGTVMNGEVSERSGENDGQGGEGDGNSVSGQPEAEAAHRWEFETGYDPSGAVVIDVKIDDAPVDGDANKITGLPNSNLVLDKRQSSGNGPFRVAFDEVLSRTIEPSIRSAADNPESEEMVDTLDVSEADVARIVPRVVSHRVRMRDDWMDQVMAGVVFRATSVGSDIGGARDVVRGKSVERRRERDGRETEDGEKEMTVKDVLVRVLQRNLSINFHQCYLPAIVNYNSERFPSLSGVKAMRHT